MHLKSHFLAPITLMAGNTNIQSLGPIHKDRCYVFLSKAIYPWETSDQLRLIPPRAALMKRWAADTPSILCPVLLGPHPPNTRQHSRPCMKIIHHKYVVFFVENSTQNQKCLVSWFSDETSYLLFTPKCVPLRLHSIYRVYKRMNKISLLKLYPWTCF